MELFALLIFAAGLACGLLLARALRVVKAIRRDLNRW